MNGITTQTNAGMFYDIFWFVIGIVSAIGFCCLIALLHRQFKQVLSDFFSIFYQPLKQSYEGNLSFINNIKSWLKSQLKGECAEEGQGPVYYIIGSFFMVVLTTIFIMCDLGLIILTLQAMGLEEVRNFILPTDTSTIVASTLVSASLFWGMILFDLKGVTHLGPWRKANPGVQKFLFISSIFFIGLAVFIVVIGGYFRGDSLEQILLSEAQANHIEPLALDPSNQIGGFNIGGTIESFSAEDTISVIDPSNSWIIKTNFMGIAFLSICTTAVSMVGLAIAAKFLLLAVIVLMSVPVMVVTFACWLLSRTVDLTQNLSESILNIFIGIGNLILDLFAKKIKS